MPDGYLIGVDIGTYSSKGVLVKANGEMVASHTVPHTMDMPRPGFFEQDADKVWWHDFVTIIHALFQKSGINPKQVLGVGTSAIGSCVLPVDEDGHALRPGILYGIDTRATKEIEYLEKSLGQEKVVSLSGSRLTSQASGPKVLWIRNNEPEIYRKARWFLTSEAYLVLKLTGQTSIDIYTAGGYAPLYDVYNRQWVKEAADLIAPLDRFPKASWSHEVVGWVTPEATRETGLAEGTPVVVGTTDAAAEAISTGMSQFGDMMLMFGSSIFFIMKTAALRTTEHFWSSNFLEAGAYAYLGGMSTSGGLTTWFRDQLGGLEVEREQKGGEDAFVSLAQLAKNAPAGCKGLILLPYFEGERTPIHDPKAKGVWFGLTLKHTRGDLYRAILEGVAYGIRHNFEVMEQEGVRPQRVFAIGGGTKNPLWLQIVADNCRTELHVPEQHIGASYGDAFLAAVGVGLYDNLTQVTEWVKTKEILRPSDDHREVYDFNYQVYRDLYNYTYPLMHRTSNRKME